MDFIPELGKGFYARHNHGVILQMEFRQCPLAPRRGPLVSRLIFIKVGGSVEH